MRSWSNRRPTFLGVTVMGVVLVISGVNAVRHPEYRGPLPQLRNHPQPTGPSRALGVLEILGGLTLAGLAWRTMRD